MTIRERIARAALGWLLRHSGHGADIAEQAALVDGLRRDHEAMAGMVLETARQGNRNATITRGILIKHQVWEKASRPLMLASRKLNANVKRANEKAKRGAAGTPDISPAQPTPPEGAGDATAARDETILPGNAVLCDPMTGAVG